MSRHLRFAARAALAVAMAASPTPSACACFHQHAILIPPLDGRQTGDMYSDDHCLPQAHLGNGNPVNSARVFGRADRRLSSQVSCRFEAQGGDIQL